MKLTKILLGIAVIGVTMNFSSLVLADFSCPKPSEITVQPSDFSCSLRSSSAPGNWTGNFPIGESAAHCNINYIKNLRLQEVRLAYATQGGRQEDVQCRYDDRDIKLVNRGGYKPVDNTGWSQYGSGAYNEFSCSGSNLCKFKPK